MLGATELDTYIYNDLSKSTYDIVNDIKYYFNMFNVVTYNNDARTFIPNDEFDTMFTCPPYFNVEKYECDDYTGFRDREEFDKFIDDLFEIFNKSNAKTFGMVIREDLIGNHTDFDDSYLLTNSTPSHLCKSKHKYNEYLYVWKKKEV
jgi:hypothetical protein